MKKILGISLIASALLFGAMDDAKAPGMGMQGERFQSVTKEQAILKSTEENKNYCPICGMYLPAFFKTNHALTLKSGQVYQYCDVHDMMEEMEFERLKGKHDQIEKIETVDTKTLQFIDAKKAFYVVGSKITGTMTKISYYAFGEKADAEAFTKENDGEIMDFPMVYAMVKKEHNNDKALTLKKREMRMYPKGKELYESACKKEAMTNRDFENIGALKIFIEKNEVCGKQPEMGMQAVSLYVWDIVWGNAKAAEAEAQKSAIAVPKDVKCPVCGMFVAKYPKWAAKMSDSAHEHYFDGVKDMMKFYFDAKKYGHEAIKSPKIEVTDYYTLEALDGTKAYYVVGSDILGPMGHELIPFKTKNMAESFLKDHKGTKVVEFKAIDTKLVMGLDK